MKRGVGRLPWIERRHRAPYTVEDRRRVAAAFTADAARKRDEGDEHGASLLLTLVEEIRAGRFEP